MEKENTNKSALMDKAFSRLLIPSMCAIFICIICLCSTTFAWFTESVPSEGNQINMAEECLLTVTVTREYDGFVFENIDQGIELEADVNYIVTLELPENTASGYCTITTTDGKTYYSDYIARHQDGQPRIDSFVLTVENTQILTFTKKWGIYSRESDEVSYSYMIIP